MITVNHLTYSYQGSSKKVFDDFSLTLKGNGIYGLLGKNGTGKSTLLYLISGLLRPGKGEISLSAPSITKPLAAIGNESVVAFRRTPEMLADLFLVPEEFDLPEISLKQFVKLNSIFYPRFSNELLNECLRDFDVDPGSNLKALSMGQKKKVFMSYALATNTQLLLMDEPTNGLDIPSKSLFRKVVASHMDESRTLIISTHQVHDIENLLDHIIVIDNSRVLLDAPTADITARYAFRTIPTTEAASAIYSEPSMGGLKAIMERQEGEPETHIDLELLFDSLTIQNAKYKMQN